MRQVQDKEASPIVIPSNSYMEGYLKSHKSIRIECNFKGTILTQKKVIIDDLSTVVSKSTKEVIKRHES